MLGLKPYKFPSGFYLIVDTREQLPLFTNPIEGLEIIKDTVHWGDYTIKGFEEYFAIERKMMSDFYGYIGREREKTVVKMKAFERMVQANGFVGLVIEASEEEVYAGYGYSKVSPETARQALASFRIRYGVHTYCSDSREAIERWILDNAIKFYKTRREV